MIIGGNCLKCGTSICLSRTRNKLLSLVMHGLSSCSSVPDRRTSLNYLFLLDRQGFVLGSSSLRRIVDQAEV